MQMMTPVDPELQEIKALFDDTVSEEYVAFAYQPQFL